MNIKTDLKNFYNKEANKYYYTRNKHRSDGQTILNEIKKINKKSISILEF
jgi:1,2-phenylacetyl-CoA epoxidase PaaB subunit